MKTLADTLRSVVSSIALIGHNVLAQLLKLESIFFGMKSADNANVEMQYAKKGMRILLYGFVGFLIWASFAPLDKGAPASGTVVNEGNHKQVQHLAGGIIDEINVKDGDAVSAGQLLIKINQTSALGEANAIAENIAGLEAQNRQAKLSIDSKKGQLHILARQLEGFRNLDKEGYISKNKLLDLERENLRIQDALQVDQGQLEKTQRQIAELNEKSNILKFGLSNTEIKSPVSGTIVNLAVFTVGGVVAPGAKLMEVIPADDPLMIDAQLPIQLIDKVHPGLPVELMFTAFNQNITPKIFGEVVTVSADRLVDEKNNFPYYKVRIQVTQKDMKKLAKYTIRPGMPVEVFIKTGERTLLSYLFKPVLDRMKTALREE
jgi:protease secretion system membrane fusion protein